MHPRPVLPARCRGLARAIVRFDRLDVRLDVRLCRDAAGVEVVAARPAPPFVWRFDTNVPTVLVAARGPPRAPALFPVSLLRLEPRHVVERAAPVAAGVESLLVTRLHHLDHATVAIDRVQRRSQGFAVFVAWQVKHRV